jgi:hypothetical protein
MVGGEVRVRHCYMCYSWYGARTGSMPVRGNSAGEGGNEALDDGCGLGIKNGDGEKG